MVRQSRGIRHVNSGPRQSVGVRHPNSRAHTKVWESMVEMSKKKSEKGVEMGESG